MKNRLQKSFNELRAGRQVFLQYFCGIFCKTKIESFEEGAGYARD